MAKLKLTEDQILGRNSTSNPLSAEDRILGRDSNAIQLRQQENIIAKLNNINKLKTAQEKYNALNDAKKLGLITQRQHLAYIQSIGAGEQAKISGDFAKYIQSKPLYKATGATKTVGNVASSIGKGIYSTGQKAANTLQLGGTLLGGALAEATQKSKAGKAAAAIGTKRLADEIVRRKTITGDYGTAFAGSPEQATNLTPEQVARMSTGFAGEVGSLIAPTFGIGVGGKVATNVLGRTGSQALARGANVATQAAINTPGFALANAMQQYGVKGKVDIPEALKQGAMTAALAGTLGSLGKIKQSSGANKKVVSKSPKVVETPKLKNDLTDTLISAANETKDKYKKGVIQKFTDKIKKAYDPATELRNIDKKMKWDTHNGAEAAFDESLNYRNKVSVLLDKQQDTGLSISKVLQNHANDSPQFNVYRNAVRDLSERNLGKKALQKDITVDQLKSIIRSYEAANPLARIEIRTINKAVNEALTYARKHGVISEELEAALMKNYDYTPIMRAKPEVDKTLAIGGRNVGSIAQQKVVQKLTGGEAPLDTTFDAVINYIDRAYKQGSQAKLASKILEASKYDAISGAKLLVTAGKKETRKLISEKIKSTSKDISKISRKLSLTNRDAGKLATAIRNLQKKGRKELSKELNKFVDDYNMKLGDKPDAVIQPDMLKQQILSLDNKEIRKIKSMISNREPKLAAKLDEAMGLKQQLLEQKGAKMQLQRAKFDFTDDTTTGLSTISGLENGQKFTLELPPELANTIKGLDVKEQGRVVKLAQDVVKGMKVFWTGPANPLFTIKNILYDASANVNALVDNPSAFVKSFKPGSIKEMFKSVSKNTDFQKEIRYSGGAIPGGSQLPTNIASSVSSIMSKRSPLARAGYLIKNPKELLEVSDMFSGKFSGMTRTRIAKGYYDDAISKGLSKEEAMKKAVYAYNNIAPNFQRTSELAKSANLISPYISASIAGTRAMLRPAMKNPKRALAVYGAITGSFAAMTAHNMSTETGKNFYKDMIDSDNQYVLDNNYIIVLPTAYKDEKTGEWKGIVKMPISPEYRPLNNLSRKETQQYISGEGGPTKTEFAGKLFDFFTGGTAQISNPLIDTTKILYGVKARSSITKPEQLVSGYMANLPKKEQAYDFTSDMGKMLSNVTGNTISPIQADALLRQFGFSGAVATGKGPVEQLKSSFTGVYAKTPQTRFYDLYDPLYSKKTQLSRAIKSGISSKTTDERINQYNSELEKAISKYSSSYKSDSELVKRLEKMKINNKSKYIKNAKD